MSLRISTSLIALWVCLPIGNAAACDELPLPTGTGSTFGQHVAIDGDVLVVSSLGGGNFVYRQVDGAWVFEQELANGRNTAISGDAIVVGNHLGESAEVFRWNGTTWEVEQILQSSLFPDTGWFGYDVDIDGDTIVVGAQNQNGDNTGAAFVFTFDGAQWNEVATLAPPAGDFCCQHFGYAVALSDDVILVGSPESDLACAPGANCNLGAVHVFRRDGDAWPEEDVLLPSQSLGSARFGRAVAVDGVRAIVGAPFDDVEPGGSAYVFAYDDTWLELANVTDPLASPDTFHFGMSVSIAGSMAGATGREAVLMYDITGTAVSSAGRIMPCVSNSGTSRSIAMDATHILLGLQYAADDGGRALVQRLDDADGDGDGVADSCDNCPLVANTDQKDNERDCLGDVCDPDDDNDGRTDGQDNCPTYFNPGQSDCDDDGRGDLCAIVEDGERDCNSNARPDTCDIASGWSIDGDGDDVPDECQPGGCVTDAECIDRDADGMRDTPCVFGICTDDGCRYLSTFWADLCTADDNPDFGGFALALACMADTVGDLCLDDGTPPYYHDVGGPNRSCAFDGVCDLNDAYASRNYERGIHGCVCPLPEDYELAAPEAPAVGGGNARVFMVPDGEQFDAPTEGSTVLQLKAGATATVMVWLETDGGAPLDLHGYQLILPFDATPLGKAAGAVTYLNTPAGSVGVNTGRTDFVHHGEQVSDVQVERLPAGVFGAAIFRGSIEGRPAAELTGIHYLAAFQVTASPDAEGLFSFDFVLEPNTAPPFVPVTDLLGSEGQRFPVDHFQSMLVLIGQTCEDTGDCADADADGIRDDNCVWWACDNEACVPTEVSFADVGGPFGACEPDGVADGNDRFHVLGCFADQGVEPGETYPCESQPTPFAWNVDVGSAFGVCAPDGVCDGADTFHILLTFAGISTCSCPLDGPAPTAPIAEPPSVPVRLVTSTRSPRPGEWVEVEVVLADPARLWGYQLHLEATGGTRGALELVDIAGRTASASDWTAFNARIGQMFSFQEAPDKVAGGTVLGTFTYRVARDAAGVFAIELRAGADDRSARSFLFGAESSLPVASPAIIDVRDHRR